MSQELLYSVLARPSLRPADLVYRRRVGAMNEGSSSKGVGSKEHRFESEDKKRSDFEQMLEHEEKSDKNRIDDIV